MHPSPLKILALIWATWLLTIGPSHAIIAGSDAAAGEFPWIAGLIQKGAYRSPALIGGGALLGDQWVITAAHSVAALEAADLAIWLRSRDLGDPGGRIVRNVLAIFIHPAFTNGTGTSENDLALLLLDEPVAGLPILPVLDDPLSLLTGDAVTVAGWGTSTPGLAEATPVLQKAPAEIISNEDATTAFGPVIIESHLAAVDPAGIATPCVGDSGGPLVKNVAGTATLVGLVSFGNGSCADASLPTIYTRIPFFAPWIHDFLDLTTVPPAFTLLGKGRTIVSNATPREKNDTDFGAVKRPGRKKNRSFVLMNAGSGLLTLRSTLLTGRGFTLVQAPTTIVGSGAATSFTVTFRGPRGRKRFRSRVEIQSNDPARPLQVINLRAKVR